MKNTGITAKKTSFWSKGNWKKLLGISLLMVAPLVGYYTFWLMSLGLLIMGFGIMGLGVADELKASEFLAKESHKEEKPERIGKLVFVILSVGLTLILGLAIYVGLLRSEGWEIMMPILIFAILVLSGVITLLWHTNKDAKLKV